MFFLIKNINLVNPDYYHFTDTEKKRKNQTKSRVYRLIATTTIYLASNIMIDRTQTTNVRANHVNILI